MDNFRTPYLAGSIHEFWQRWHISLSTWFRDYVYIPLGGSKVRIARWVVNIFAVFLLSGFWHGANWTFLIWGGIHGGLYLLERFGNYTGLPQKIPALLRRPLGIMLTFFIVHIAWIFFRIEHVEDFGTIIHNLMHPSGTETLIFPTAKMTMLVLFILFDFMLLNTRFDRWVGHRPVAMRWAIYLILIFCILAFGGVTNHPFIYFQF
jgi:D-alanyl-lipoteichoic acid acyltransferase DltB (MBOAT superfamily)